MALFGSAGLIKIVYYTQKILRTILKALALFSGGLDSLLACKLITDQGIDVLALNFDFGFAKTDKRAQMKAAAAGVGADFESVDIQDAYEKNVLFSPRYGYGKAFNPCIDCHGFMFKTALSMLGERGASFVISGEVLAQRPMSQNKNALGCVAKLSGGGDLILRPLSAKLLAPSLPEQRGWVDRQRLLALSGRDRKPQMELAARFGISSYETPAGGCLLTDKFFKTKMLDLLSHDAYKKEDAIVLKYGRHFRLPGGAKLVIARNESENAVFLERTQIFSKYELILQPPNAIGAVALLSKTASLNDERLSAEIISAYTQKKDPANYTLKIKENFYTSPKAHSKELYKEFLLK